jgi:hypothetical protein
MDGGALLVKDSAHVTLVGSTIRNCKSSEGKGGAIAVLDFANATIANSSVVESNHATEVGVKGRWDGSLLSRQLPCLARG